ncbi:Pre-mRNA 3'-end-processing endonuclease polyadenylation factor C-term-domain-containing protein [Lipomyces kononenkoae]
MSRLKSALLGKYKDLRQTENEVKVFNPRNSEELRLPFRGVKRAKVVGALAAKPPIGGQIISGILVQKNFEMSIMAADDLKEFSGLTTSSIIQRQSVAVEVSAELVKFHLEQMFGTLKDTSDASGIGYTIMDSVNVLWKPKSIVIEWEGNMLNDAIADSVLAILLSVDSSPMSLRISSKPSHCKATLNRTEKVERVLVFLDSQFGSAVEPMDNPDDGVYIKIDEHVATVNFRNMDVICTYEPLRSRVMHVLNHAVDTILPFDSPTEDSYDGDTSSNTVAIKNES